MPSQKPIKTAPSALESYGNASNVNMVYATDEFGNNIAVGVFVTNKFTGNEGKMEGIESQDINKPFKEEGSFPWVGACEECPTQATEVDEKGKCNDEEPDVNVQVYKVNKRGKSAKKRVPKSQTSGRTLRELKKKPGKVKVEVTKKKARIPAKITAQRVLREGRRKKHVRCQDRAYRPSYSIPSVSPQSKFNVMPFMSFV